MPLCLMSSGFCFRFMHFHVLCNVKQISNLSVPDVATSFHYFCLFLGNRFRPTFLAIDHVWLGCYPFKAVDVSALLCIYGSFLILWVCKWDDGQRMGNLCAI